MKMNCDVGFGKGDDDENQSPISNEATLNECDYELSESETASERERENVNVNENDEFETVWSY